MEDFEDSRFSLCRLLEMSGYEVLEAADGGQAVEVAVSALPDLVLMDLTLPVMDGIEATKRIRAAEGTPRMPIIAVSAYDAENASAEAVDAGCDGYVTKPIDYDELEALIGRMLK